MSNFRKMFDYNPSTGEIIWSGEVTTPLLLTRMVEKAKEAQKEWEKSNIEVRINVLKRFADIVSNNIDNLATVISEDNGKPFWEAQTEVKSLVNKVDVVIKAYDERAAEKSKELANGRISYTRYKPYGVMAVLGPFNFPMSMPNSHIMPAIFAGNAVLFKPSERTIKASVCYADIWAQAGLPDGLLQIVYGDLKIAQKLIKMNDVDGALFVGSYKAGKSIEKIMAARNRICALEMGGNSPLVIWDYSDIRAAVNIAIQSSFISSGQRCSAARRLIINHKIYSEYVQKLSTAVSKIKVGKPFDNPAPFMGPMIDERAVSAFFEKYYDLVNNGAKVLVPSITLNELGPNFVSPSLLDVTDSNKKDDEIFGPLLQIESADSIEQAISISNNTIYGLAAGIVTEDPSIYSRFFNNVKAGIINWNQQLTGSTTINPFGGIKGSGNFHAAGYLSVDYCSYGCASIESSCAVAPKVLSPGLDF